ncbi:MAG TPA: hypothetical protein VJ032_08565 [Thermoanaerobaculia bacterium]|nr:hypothetical protein [Thermoanaerobaculia bacterium]
MRRQRHPHIPPPAVTTAPETAIAPPWSSREWAIVAALVALTAIVFGQLFRHEFLFGDDALFRAPLLWQPLTTLTFFGRSASAQLLLNLVLHAASAAVLFVAMRKLTGATGRSAFVAALFAIHPMHVETVARLAERKQLLATLFALLALLAYAHRRLALVAVAFAASLLSDPTYVALPLILLVLDWWPLARLRTERDLRPLLIEKLPLFVLAIAGAAIAIVSGWNAQPFPNAIASYVRFLGRFFAPTGPAMPYPVTTIDRGTVGGAIALLVLISFAAIAFRRSVPWLTAGWFWFVIALTGAQSFADRYSYFSYIGLSIIVAWAGALLLPRAIAIGVAAIVVIACAAGSFQQTSYWRNSETLYAHTIEVTPPNADAEYALGASQLSKNTDDAIEHLQRGIELAAYSMRTNHTERPSWFAQAHVDIARAFIAKGEKESSGAERTNLLQGAIGASRRALAVDSKIGGATELIARAEQLIAADPHAQRDAHLNAGTMLSQQGRFPDAVAEFRKAVAAEPNSVDAHVYLALGMLQANMKDEARNEFAAAKTLDAGAANEVLTKALQMPPSPANFDGFVARIR